MIPARSVVENEVSRLISFGLKSATLKIMSTVRALLLSALFGLCCCAQAPDDNIASLAGQFFVLPKVGNEAKVHVRKDQIGRIKGSCDIAVQVSSIDLTGGVAHVQLENIGIPMIPSQPYLNKCPSGAKPNINLEISGFTQSDSGPSVLASIGEVLLTSERYLSYRGVVYSFDTGGVTSDEPSSTEKPDAKPIPLLTLTANNTELAHAQRHSGAILISVIVGKDGRAHSPKVIRPLGLGLDENVLRVLPLWRFQPAQKGGKPVPCRATLETNFRQF